MKKVLGIAMLAAITLSVSPALSQDAEPVQSTNAETTVPANTRETGRRSFNRQGKGKRSNKLMQMLSAEQKTQMKSIVQSSREEAKPIVEKLRALREANQGNGSFDENSKEEFVALRKQMKEHRKQVREKILAILTPEQKVEFENSKGFGAGGGFRHGRGKRGAWGAPGALGPSGGPLSSPASNGAVPQ